VAQAYVALTAGRAQLRLWQVQRDDLAQQLKIIQAKVATGESALDDQERAAMLVAAADAALADTGAQIHASLIALAVLRGLDPAREAIDVTTPEHVPIAEDPWSVSPAQTLAHRPDVLAAFQALQEADAGVALAVSEYYPNISLSALIGQIANVPATLTSGRSTQAQAGAALRWRIFDFARIDAEVARAKGRRKEALLGYRAAVLRAAAEVEQAVLTLGERHRGLQAAESRRRAAQSRATIARAAEASGATSRFDTLEAERQLAQGLAAESDARWQLAMARVSAAWALGAVLVPDLGRVPASPDHST
jgi:outer membrane protein TolC